MPASTGVQGRKWTSQRGVMPRPLRARLGRVGELAGRRLAQGSADCGLLGHTLLLCTGAAQQRALFTNERLSGEKLIVIKSTEIIEYMSSGFRRGTTVGGRWHDRRGFSLDLEPGDDLLGDALGAIEPADDRRRPVLDRVGHSLGDDRVRDVDRERPALRCVRGRVHPIVDGLLQQLLGLHSLEDRDDIGGQLAEAPDHHREEQRANRRGEVGEPCTPRDDDVGALRHHGRGPRRDDDVLGSDAEDREGRDQKEASASAPRKERKRIMWLLSARVRRARVRPRSSRPCR